MRAALMLALALLGTAQGANEPDASASKAPSAAGAEVLVADKAESKGHRHHKVGPQRLHDRKMGRIQGRRAALRRLHKKSSHKKSRHHAHHALLPELGTVPPQLSEFEEGEWQCPAAQVSMPCPNSSDVAPIHHLHFGKMAGRRIAYIAPELFDQEMCKWAPYRYHKSTGYGAYGDDFGDEEKFNRMVKRHEMDMIEDPCFTTYEINGATEFTAWDELMNNSFGDHAIGLMALREPVSWAWSAIEHDYRRGFHKGIADLRERNCFANVPELDMIDCHGFAYAYPAAPLWATESKEKGQFDEDEGFEVAKKRLDESLFGIVEELSASTCLWAFQMGQTLNETVCDCTKNGGDDDIKHIGADASADTEMPEPTEDEKNAVATINFGAYERVYQYADALFRARVKVAEKETGLQLLCDASSSLRATKVVPATALRRARKGTANASAPQYFSLPRVNGGRVQLPDDMEAREEQKSMLKKP